MFHFAIIYQAPQILHCTFGRVIVECCSMCFCSKVLVLKARAHVSQTKANEVTWTPRMWDVNDTFVGNLKSNSKRRIFTNIQSTSGCQDTTIITSCCIYHRETTRLFPTSVEFAHEPLKLPLS